MASNDELPPSAVYWLQEMEMIYFVFLLICSAATVVTIAMAILHLCVIHRQIANYSIRCDLTFFALLFPIVSGTSLIGLYLPRSAHLMYTTSVTYTVICLHKLVIIIMNLCGSCEELAMHIESKQQLLVLSTAPLCCCCKCLPKIKPNVNNLRRIGWLVSQTPIVRIAAQLILLIIWNEDAEVQGLNVAIEIIQTLSMMIATWSANVFLAAGKEILHDFKFSFLSQFVILTQAALLLQKFVFSLVSKYAFGSGPILTADSKAIYWNGVAMIFEMLTMSVTATIVMNPKQSALFTSSEISVYSQRMNDINR